VFHNSEQLYYFIEQSVDFFNAGGKEMDKRLDYQLTDWVTDEMELQSHMAQLRKYGTPYELREQDKMFAVFREDPRHEVI